MKKPIFFSLIITVAMLSLIISCADRLDTYDIIQTTTTEQKLDNDAGTATAIAERKVSMDATAAAGGELDLRLHKLKLLQQLKEANPFKWKT